MFHDEATLPQQHADGADMTSQHQGDPRHVQEYTAMSPAVSTSPSNNTLHNDTLVHEHKEIKVSSPAPCDNQDIEYLYMTFDTDVALKPIFPNGSQPDAPPSPDLLKFQDPFEWARSRKNTMTYICCMLNAVAAYASGAYADAEPQLTKKWHVDHVVFNLGITVFTTGFGIAPMILAPFSEINGRRPVLVATGTLFVISTLGCAVTDSFGGMLASRFFLGCGGSVFSTMGGGIIADIWKSADRNTSMVLFTGATLFGTGLGPLVSGFVAQNLLWRWVFYIQIITSGLLIGYVTIFFKETRGSIVLSQKAKAFNKWYSTLEEAGCIGMELYTEEKAVTRRIRYKVLADEQRTSLLKMIGLSLYRPFHMLVTEPVVFWFSVWISFAWSVLYLQFASVPLVFEVNHNFTLQQTGLVFIAMCVGAIISTCLSIYQEKWGMKRWPEKIGGSPEGRMLFTCIESALVPIGLFWFGWTCYPSIHPVVPAIAVGVATMGIFSVFLAVFNYSADVYHSYASSALAASGVCRNLLAGCFPLVTHQLFNNLGFQGASSLLGAIAAALTLVPWVLVAFGPKIRARSKIASQFVGHEG